MVSMLSIKYARFFRKGGPNLFICVLVKFFNCLFFGRKDLTDFSDFWHL